jgi:hypothetical protein
MLIQGIPGKETQERPLEAGLPQASQEEQILLACHLVSSSRVLEKKFILLALSPKDSSSSGGCGASGPINIFVFVCHNDVNAYDFISNCLGARPDLI